MKITYHKGNLFDILPKDAYIAHAVNCQGVWGAGFAAQLKKLYPEDYKEYQEYCDFRNKLLEYAHFPKPTRCPTLITKNKIINLFTSNGYGSSKDTVKTIVFNTSYALLDLCLKKSSVPINSVIYSPKFNSGLFGVPWEETEKELEIWLKARPDISWNVVKL